MAEKTTNYELVKPLPEEFYDVAVQNENMDKIDAALNALQKNKAELVNGKINPEQIPFAGIPIVQTQGDGAAYTASVEGITELARGTAIIMLPNKTSTTDSPTLDINGQGAKGIRRAISTTTTGAAVGNSTGWIGTNRPILLIYNGNYWVDQGRTRPYASDLIGTVGIDHGGTGATNADDARAQLGAAAKEHTHDAGDINDGTLDAERLPVVPVTKGGTGNKTGMANSLKNGNGAPVTVDTTSPPDATTYIAIWEGSVIKRESKSSTLKTNMVSGATHYLFNNKQIYRYVADFGAIAANAAKNVTVNSLATKQILAIHGFGTKSHTNDRHAISSRRFFEPNIQASARYVSVLGPNTNFQITVSSSSDDELSQVYVIVYYCEPF